MREELAAECLLNFDFLLAKVEAFSLRETIDDFSLKHDNNLCARVAKALNVSRSSLNRHPNTLACVITAHLLESKSSDHDSKYLKSLVRACVTRGTKENKLMPRRQLYDDVDERVLSILTHPLLPDYQRHVVGSADASSLLIRLWDNLIGVWDLASGEMEKQLTLWPDFNPPLNVMRPCDVRLNSVTGKYAAHLVVFTTSQAQDGWPISVVDLDTCDVKHCVTLNCPELEHPGPGALDSLHLLAFQHYVIISVTEGKCKIFDLETGEVVTSLSYDMTLLQIDSEAMKLFMVCPENGVMKVVCMQTWEWLKNIELVIDRIWTHMFSTRDRIVLASTEFHHLCVYNKNTDYINYLDLLDELQNEDVHDVILSQDRTLAAFCHQEGALVVDLDNLRVVRTCQLPDKHVTFKKLSFAFSSDGRHLLSANTGCVLVWSVRSSAAVKEVKFRDVEGVKQVMCVARSDVTDQQAVVLVPETTRSFYVISLEATLSSARVQVASKSIKMASSVFRLLSAHTCSSTLAYNSSFTELFLLDAERGQGKTLTFKNKEIHEPVASLDGKFFFVWMKDSVSKMDSLSRERGVVVFSMKTGKQVSVVYVSRSFTRLATFSHSSRYIITQSHKFEWRKSHISIWDISSKTAKLVTSFPVQNANVGVMQCIYGDKYVVCLYKMEAEQVGCDLVVYEVESGSVVHSSSGYGRRTLLTVEADDSIAFVSKEPKDRAKNPQPNELIARSLTRFCFKTLTAEELGLPQFGNWDFDANGSRAVNSALEVFDTRTCTQLCAFADISMLHQPCLSSDGRLLAWFNTEDLSINIADVDRHCLIGRAFTQSLAASLQLCCHDNVVVVGCQDGHLLLYDVIDSKEKKDSVLERHLGKGMSRTTRFCQLL